MKIITKARKYKDTKVMVTAILIIEATLAMFLMHVAKIEYMIFSSNLFNLD